MDISDSYSFGFSYGFNNFLDDPTASQSDPAWKEDYESNMGLDECKN